MQADRTRIGHLACCCNCAGHAQSDGHVAPCHQLRVLHCEIEAVIVIDALDGAVVSPMHAKG